MRIGELAALAGVSTRAVRHYHASGVLPDAARRSNGYRDYTAADLIRLLRVVRLTALGLTLAEVRSVHADEQDLRVLLADVVADLAEQQATLDRQRADLLALMASDHDLTSSPGVAALLVELAAVAPEVAGRSSERTLLELMRAGSTDTEFAEFAGAYRDSLRDSEAVATGRRIDRQLAELADADPGDPRLEAVAAELAAVGRQHFGSMTAAGSALAWELALDTMTPAQRRCLELAAEAFETETGSTS
ncbi:MerR family transcriptional regulator [Nakamurella lactea]|uniref:MerR family transcriptional regulator n=1 Tax=Nakamurella lactea TaxID=459515 RepID=UPI0004035F43|nr:MerR family transcriptional regulator [Nakamurella lactea]